MKNFLTLKIWKSFLPFKLSSDPWDIPILKINNKQINGEMVKVLILKAINEKILQSKKKMKEWLKFIFFIYYLFFNLLIKQCFDKCQFRHS